jgi:lipid II:glycine glycyltransferase (peptidoglycan interpeptide bridge formation enzyme)
MSDQAVPHVSGYDVSTSNDLTDPEWDAFVAATPGGTHQQSSMWAEVKAVQGWGVSRVLLRDAGDRLVGGCQVLLRRLARPCVIGYVPRGPVVAGRDEGALDAILLGLREVAARERLLYLKLQPPPDRGDLVPWLQASGFVESSVQAVFRASVQVDLGPSPDELLARMRSSTRRNIRKAGRAGVVVRAGGEPEFQEFMRLTEATGQRKRFTVYPRRYYEQMWRSFGDRGHARLLVAELDGRALASILLLTFGETVAYKMGGWAGERPDLHVNELLQWTGISWAHEHGHRYYDFEGVNWAVAKALLAEGGRPTSSAEGVSHFKLGFGGDLCVFPGTFDYTYPRPLAGVVRRLVQLDRSPLVVTAAKRMLRVGGS